MRNRVLVAMVLVLGVVAVAGIYAGTKENDKASLDLQVRQLSNNLGSLIVPPDGTTRAEVDKVFGTPEVIPEAPKRGKGDGPAAYPKCVYKLLEPRANQDFRAVLFLTWRDGTVSKAGINHICTSKGLPVFAAGSPQAKERARQLTAERRAVLIDLLEIYSRFHDKLDQASWNPPNE